ncbi:MAG: phosphoribosylanthranilate isomerase [Syntrophales bacterium]|nr:phosphoribosylanthranilate isomerase [Syntrophales bacterium]
MRVKSSESFWASEGETMTGIKICGITDLDDALVAAEAGADALGFIFYPKSLRYVSPERAKEIIAGLPSGIAKVGVFVNDEPERVAKITESCGLDLLQLHGDETPEYCRLFPAPMVIKAFSLRTAGDLGRLADYPVRAILVDAFVPGLYGGTGKMSNWELAKSLKQTCALILSGGLNSENIQDAIVSVSPHAVDINSGVESSPGRKDHEKIRRIIEIIRRGGWRTGEKGTDIFHDH